MGLDYAKAELIKRYKYLYENAEFILAPFMYMENEKELKEPLIYLNLGIKNTAMMNIFEEFLLTNENIDTTVLYKSVERNKSNIDFLKKYQNGMILYKKTYDHNLAKNIKLDISTILYLTIIYVNEQSGDLKNKENKIKVLDEYMNLYNYKNKYMNYIDFSSLIHNQNKSKPSRNKSDIGLKGNAFIETIASAEHHIWNDSIFTEKEKQEVYLSLHDELPWDLITTCAKSEAELNFRQEYTNPCQKTFYIKESEIYMKPIDEGQSKFHEEFYQLCPHCGYINIIPKELISVGVRERIEKRCQEDKLLFKKMCLYSELRGLEKISPTKGKRLVK